MEQPAEGLRNGGEERSDAAAACGGSPHAIAWGLVFSEAKVYQARLND